MSSRLNLYLLRWFIVYVIAAGTIPWRTSPYVLASLNFSTKKLAHAGVTARRHFFGRKAESQAWPSATGGRPPWREISRLIVEAARSSRRAISRSGEPEAIPRDIFSRSPRVSARRQRRRAAGGILPRGNNKHRRELCGLSKGAPNLMQRLSRFPSAPDVALLHRRKPKPFPDLIQHQLSRADLRQMVLLVQTTSNRHRPTNRLRRNSLKTKDRKISNRGQNAH